MTSEPFRESGCGHCLGVLMLLYGLFNTYLFIKFTPVYTATSCGDQTALLKKFEVGDSIHVGVEIHVLCSNPNPYDVKILNDTPGSCVRWQRSRPGGVVSNQGRYSPKDLESVHVELLVQSRRYECWCAYTSGRLNTPVRRTRNYQSIYGQSNLQRLLWNLGRAISWQRRNSNLPGAEVQCRGGYQLRTAALRDHSSF